jgi:signal transduction histidine kinase
VSLRLRLTLLNGVVLLLAIGAFAAVAYVTQAQVLRNSLDASLREQARWFSDNAGIFSDRPFRQRRSIVLPDPRRFAAPDVFIQFADRSGEIDVRSRNLGDDTLPFDRAMLARALSGQEWFADVEVDGQPLRLFVAPFRVGGLAEQGPPIGVIEVARPLATLQGNLRTLQVTFLGVAGAGVLLSLAAGWLLAREALRPIDRLAAAAQSIGAARDFGRRVPVRPGARRDEVGRLAEEFNRMLAQLQAAYEQLQAAHDQLDVALASQRRFVADASHELRTPLAVLRGNLDLLRSMTDGSTDGDAEERAQILSEMAGETERTARLVGGLLLLAQADAGQHLTLAPTALGPVVRDAFRAARFLREGLELRLGDVPEETWVAGDADRLKQLLLILLDNALKYTPPGGRVTIDARHLSRAGIDGVAVRIADTGPGIPSEEQARIFERFYRADRARAAAGAGLGLAIARWLVEEHRGAIDVESTPGRGSLFTVWLPTIAPPGPGAHEAPAAQAAEPALVG